MGTQQIYNTAAVALGLGVMVKGSRNQVQEISVWICHRRICSYIECVRINGWNRKKTRKRVKERKRPTMLRKSHREKATVGQRGPGVEFG